jgi:hypothetical protein
MPRAGAIIVADVIGKVDLVCLATASENFFVSCLDK